MGPPSEMLAAAAFVLSVLTVFAAAAWEAGRWALERLGRAGAPTGRLPILRRRAVLGAAGIGLLCILWGRFVEPRWPEVTRVRIESPKLRAGARPVRIVHLSDLHCVGTPLLEERLPGLVAAERPDAVVFTGDSINEPAGLPVFRRAMEGLARVAPTFVVEGNWDARYFPGLDRFGGTGARELDGRSVRLDVDGTAVRFAGVHYGNETALGESLRGASPSEFLVYLYHTPDLAPELAGRGVDLAVAGHTHGGQVRLPLYGAILTLSRFGKRFEAGPYEVDGMRLHVNRGIGMEAHGLPRVRFLCRPEITVVEIAPPGPGPAE